MSAEAATMGQLLSRHRSLVESSAISPDVAAARGYVSITFKQELLDLDFTRAQARVPGLLIPLWRVDGQRGGYQHRPDSPRVLDGKPVKYETPPGQLKVLDVPSTVCDHLHKGRRAVFITEGARKAPYASAKLALRGIHHEGVTAQVGCGLVEIRCCGD